MNTNISNLLNKRYAPHVLWGAAACGAVVAGVYILRRVRQNSTIVVVPAEPIQEVTPDEILDDASVEEVTQEETELTIVDATPNVVNVFMAETDDDWDQEFEVANRLGDEPYIIHVEEYIENEFGFKQETVTYYALDDIMANMQDVPIYNWSEMMGTLRWGHGSKDKNVVYVRNEQEQREWEILLHQGSYEIEVKGLHDDGGELRHSMHRVPKFRDL